MKKVIAITIVLTLVLAAVSSCKRSPEGGSTRKGEGFKIDVPTFDTKVKPGEIQTVTIKLQRGESFKRDVKLEIEAAKGISIDPAKVLVKAGDKPDVQLTITAPKDAALGEYRVSVRGIPKTGEPTSVEFKVKVVASEADYTIKSDSPKGGSTRKGEGFKIAVPTFSTDIKQGQTQNITVLLERGDYFKQDVKLQIKTSTGISVDPTSVVIKASDKPDVQLKIAAAQNAALGEYRVSVTGIPKTGESTSTEFNVKVVAP